MSRFPLFVDITGLKTVIVGGGRIAFRKAGILAGFGADILVISPEICEGLKRMEEKGQLRYEQSSVISGKYDILDPAQMVICATEDRQLNHEIACYCHDRRIWVDCADSEADSSFLFPSVVRRDEIVIGISSSGGVPALTRHLRHKIEQAIPEWYGDLEKTLRAEREKLKQTCLSHEEKREKLRRIIEREERNRSE